MKFLFVLLVVAVAAMAHPERERRGLPILAAPATAIVTPVLHAPLLSAGHGSAILAGPALVGNPWGAKTIISPGIWG